MRTVGRRKCSAISPNPGMAMLFSSVRAFTHNDTGFLRDAATNKFDRHRFADYIGSELRVHILHSRDRMPAESDQHIADHNACLLRGTLRLHFDGNGCSFFIALQRLAESLR